MPARVIESPLTVEFTFPNAAVSVVRLDQLALPALARDLALGLTMQVHPHGTVTTRKSAGNLVWALRHMVTWLAQAGFRGSASQLTRGMLLQYWLSCGWQRESLTRALLRGFDTATGGLPLQVRTLLQGRFLHQPVRCQPRKPYTETEWDRLRTTCQQVIDASWSAHRDAVALADTGGDPLLLGEEPANLAWLLRRRGPEPTDHLLRLLGEVGTWTAQRGRHLRIRALREALFPTVDVVIAYRLLFGVHSGIVPDGIDSLGLQDIDWAGDATVLLSYIKGRTGPEGVVLSRAAVRLLQRWLQHSTLLRVHAPQARRQQLWIAAATNHTAAAGSWITAAPFDSGATPQWVKRHGLLGDDGRPLAIHRSRIRTTYPNYLKFLVDLGRLG